jgi:hypothetical protein
VLKRKRAVASLGAGIFIFIGGFLTLLFILRLLNSPQWMYTIIIWMLVWPTRLVGCVIAIPYPKVGGAAFVLSIGIITDIAILSGLVYAALSLLGRKSPKVSPPPPPLPPPFQ